MNYGNPYAPPQQQAHDPYYNNQRRHPDDNVSAPAPDRFGDEHYTFASARGGSRSLPPHEGNYQTNHPVDRVNEPEAPSPTLSREKTVQFDLNPQEEPSREASPVKADRHEEHRDDDDGDGGHRRHRRRKDDERSDSTRGSGRDRKRHRRDDSPGSDASDTTIELPPRFDEQGHSRTVDPVADKLESVLQSLFR